MVTPLTRSIIHRNFSKRNTQACPPPPPIEIEKQKKKKVFRFWQLFHPYFATFLVEMSFSELFSELGPL